jgi:predicted DNA-binding protein
MKTIRVTHTIPKELEDQLIKASDKTGIKKSTIVKQGLELWMKQYMRRWES